jgi:hypothetical protein
MKAPSKETFTDTDSRLVPPKLVFFPWESGELKLPPEERLSEEAALLVVVVALRPLVSLLALLLALLLLLLLLPELPPPLLPPPDEDEEPPPPPPRGPDNLRSFRESNSISSFIVNPTVLNRWTPRSSYSSFRMVREGVRRLGVGEEEEDCDKFAATSIAAKPILWIPFMTL